MIYVMLWKFFWNHQKYNAMENHTMENHVRQGLTVLLIYFQWRQSGLKSIFINQI